MQPNSRLARAALGALFAVSMSAHASPLKLESELGAQPRVNSVARLMSGLEPTAVEHRAFAQTDAWQKHSEAMTASWNKLRESRITAMAAWRNEAISAGCPLGKTLLYPFSGPDFFNAYWLFPECETFVMFGLEHPGKVPDVEAMNERQRERLIEDVRKATSDLFRRNYFITDNMTRQLSTPHLRGVVPLVMVSMALSGVEVVRVLPNEVIQQRAADGKRPMRDIKGVTVEFRAPGSPVVRRMHYFSLDATDKGLAHYPEFIDYLKSLAPTTTLIKSASYLLHNELFRTMGKTIAEVSGVLVQDDTGLPYATLAKGWDVKLYGRYFVPIKPFAGAYQPELGKVWKAQQPAALPFTFGYQYNDRRDERSHVMVARRLSSPATAGDAPARRAPAKGAQADSILRASTPQPR
jgi:hypothetical protein